MNCRHIAFPVSPRACLVIAGLLAHQARVISEGAPCAPSTPQRGADVCHTADSAAESARSTSVLQAGVSMQQRSATLAAVPLGNTRRETSHSRLRSCIQEYAAGLDAVQQGLGYNVRNLSLQPTARSERAVVFGAGSGTTATRSLHASLRELGMSGWHFRLKSNWTMQLLQMLGQHGVADGAVSRGLGPARRSCRAALEAFDYTSLPSDVEYVLDTPADQLFIHLFLSYPNARFILTTRPLLKWVARRRQHKGTLAPIMDPCQQYVEAFPNDAKLAQLEDLKRRLVRCAVPKHRLLEFSVFDTPKEQMREIAHELAAFVGHPSAKAKSFPGSTLQIEDVVAGKLFGKRR